MKGACSSCSYFWNIDPWVRIALLRTEKSYLMKPVYQNSILLCLYMPIFKAKMLRGRGRVARLGPFGTYTFGLG